MQISEIVLEYLIACNVDEPEAVCQIVLGSIDLDDADAVKEALKKAREIVAATEPSALPPGAPTRMGPAIQLVPLWNRQPSVPSWMEVEEEIPASSA